MKIKGTVRKRVTKLGTFGVFTSLEMAQFAGKEVELDVTEVVVEQNKEGELK